VLGSTAESIERGGVKAFKLVNSFQQDTGESRWIVDLNSDKNYEIKEGRAFRITSFGLVDPKKEAVLIQSLQTDDARTHFKLPYCHTGDTLVLIVVYQQREHPANDDPPEFRSYAP